jgi:hypothetical protein
VSAAALAMFSQCGDLAERFPGVYPWPSGELFPAFSYARGGLRREELGETLTFFRGFNHPQIGRNFVLIDPRDAVTCTPPNHLTVSHRILRILEVVLRTA